MTESLAAVKMLLTIGQDQEKQGGKFENIKSNNDRDSVIHINYTNNINDSTASLTLQDIDEEIKNKQVNGSNKNDLLNHENWEMVVEERKDGDSDDNNENQKGQTQFVNNFGKEQSGVKDDNFKIIHPDLLVERKEHSVELSDAKTDFNDYRDVFMEKIDKCGAYLKACSSSVIRLKGLIVKDLLNLSLVVHEPEIWRRLEKESVEKYY